MTDEFQEQEVKNVSLTDYLRIIYRGRWVIIISFIVVFIVSVIYTYNMKPVYQSATTIIIDMKGSNQSSIFNFNSFGNQNTHIANQLEIIKSRTLAERVVKRLELSELRDSLSLFQPNEKGEYRTLRQMVGSVKNTIEVINKKDTDIIEITISAPSPFEAAFLANTVAQEYTLASEEFNRGEIKDLRGFLEDQLSRKEEELRSSEDLLRNYQEREKVASLDDETKELINRLSQIESNLEQSRVMLEANLEMKASLERQLDERKLTLATEISEISTPYVLTLQSELASLVSEKTKYMTAVEIEAQGVNRQFFQSNISQYDEKIKALKEKLTEEAQKISKSSMVKDPFQLSQELVKQLITLEAEVKSTTAKINTLQELAYEYNREMEKLPVKVLELARLERRRLVDEQTFVMMTTKLEETKIQEAGQRRNVRIIDEAIESAMPTKPNKTLNMALGMVLGLGLGIGLTFLREYLDNSIKSQEDLEKLGYNILASIPKIQMGKVEEKIESRLSKLGPIEGRRIEARLITHLDPKSPVSESYRTLRTNLQFSRVEKSLKTLLITSSGPKEGKSTTSANLAIAMAQTGKKVVLLDADLRRPVVHSIFGIDKDDGLTNYLMNDISYEKMIKKSIVDNLSIIPSGILPPNPSELLSSKRMEELIEKLKKDFDIVIFDTPPVIAVTDAAILATKVDGCILVVYSGQTKFDAVTRAKALIENVGARMLGALLNGVEVGGMYGTYYYYYYHSYYSRPNKKLRKNV